MVLPLLLATRNPDKVEELRKILEPCGFVLHSMAAFKDFPETVEDRDSIAGNAIKKALEGARHSGMLCLADDTGLFVDALDGAPGIYSARYAGEGCSYQDNRRKLLIQMEAVSDRKARFQTAMALADRHGLVSVVYGTVEGKITSMELGDNGFGYDSIFEVEGSCQTYAQMTDEEKNYISHRGLAVGEMLPLLKRILNQNE